MSLKAKPFIKWVGGKGQILEQLEMKLPADFDNWEDATYIEPFVGGGAMLFYMLQQHPNIKRAIINDINSDLITCYKTIRDDVDRLISSLQNIQAQYYALTDLEEKRKMFITIRQRYNEKNLDPIENTTMFIFLNRTCFNGLYRVNKKGLFNVPYGKYIRPKICDENTLKADSLLLRRVEILEGDFENTFDYAQGKTLFYLDPPYRPLSDTSSFNDYTKDAFNDDSQVRLKIFCDKIVAAQYHLMLSNSDCKSINEENNFFDLLYCDYFIERVMASRNVNAIGTKRGKISELLIHNYSNTKELQLSNKKETKESQAHHIIATQQIYA